MATKYSQDRGATVIVYDGAPAVFDVLDSEGYFREYREGAFCDTQSGALVSPAGEERGDW